MSARRRTLLLLGGTGFLGARLAQEAARAWDGRCLVAARRPERLPAFPGRERLEPLAWDAREPGATERLLERARPVAVVCCAALARPGDCEHRPDLALLLNAVLPGEVAAHARHAGARCVHVSTDLVFGGRPARGSRYDEEDPPAPLHVYGASKARGEEAVRAADGGALVVRLPLLFGDSLGRGLGASDGLLAALARGERPTLFTDEWRTPLDVGVAARALLELARGDAEGLLHVAGPERLSRLELGRLVLEARGRVDVLRAGTRGEAGLDASRPRDVGLDARRARALLATVLEAPAESLRAGGARPSA